MLKPIFMWAGGKSKMRKHYAPILPTPDEFHHYVEPFLGGGAVYGSYGFQFPSAILNDSNTEIIGIYHDLSQDSDLFISEVQGRVAQYFEAPPDKNSRKKYYYDLRQEYWDCPSSSLLYVLMRLGFNGIWQTCKDSKGLFGTPAGLLNHTKPVQVFNPELLQSWSKHLREVVLTQGDYSEVSVPSRSFVFCDPPYRDSFTTYATQFGDEEQTRLVTWMLGLVDSGSTVAFSNRSVKGESYFEDMCSDRFDFYYFPVTYTAGRRKRTENGYAAKEAVEFLALSK